MNRKLITSALLTSAAALAPSAFAQTTTDWTGLYVGVQAGLAKEVGKTDRVAFDTNRDGNFNDTVRTSGGADAFSPGFCQGAARGATVAEGCRYGADENLGYGIKAGYDWQFGNFVIGAVGDWNAVNIRSDVSGFSTTPASYTFTRDLKSVAALRARAGYAFDTSLVYATGGWAWGDMKRGFSTTNTANTFDLAREDDPQGYQIGAGYELKLNNMMGSNWSVGIEYLWTQLEDDSVVAVGRGTSLATNPFVLVNSTGTDMARQNEDFQFGQLNLTLNWRQ
jgi:hypothetical protein